MILRIQKKMILMKHIASVWFIGLGIVNVIMSAASGTLRWTDFLLLTILSFPAIINRWPFYLFTGILQILFGCFMLIGTIVSHSRHLENGLPMVNVWLGYLISTSFLFASLLYLFTGMEQDNRKFSLDKMALSIVYGVLVLVMFLI